MATRMIPFMVLGAVGVLFPAVLAAQIPGDTLTLGEVYAQLDAANPMLQAAGSRVEAVASLEGAAGLPPDPQLRLGVMNAGLPDLKTDMPSSMAPSVELMQMVPIPGKLGLAKDIARFQTRIAGADAEELRWRVRSEAAMAYYEIFAADRKVETMRGTLRLLEDFEKVARAMYASGEGRQADVLRASVEIARMRAEIERMTAMREIAVARLNALLGRPADTPIPVVADPAEPGPLPSAGTLREWAATNSPVLSRGALAVQQAGSQLDLARRELWPDLSVGLQYGQRGGAMGTERMGSLMVGFSVPVFAGQRQLRMREEATAMGRMAEAELASAGDEVDARITATLADLDRAETLIELYTEEVLPQAAAAVESAFASYRVGAVDFMTLVDARMTVDQYERELHELRAEEAQAVAELESTIGRELPRVPQPRGEG